MLSTVAGFRVCCGLGVVAGGVTTPGKQGLIGQFSVGRSSGSSLAERDIDYAVFVL